MAASTYSEAEIIEGLMALVAFAGDATSASRHLKSSGKRAIPVATLRAWKTTKGDRYNEMRDKYSAQKEAQLVHEYRDAAAFATHAERLAIEKTIERLEKNEDNDPAKSAANMAKVAQVMTDKALSLSGRPTQITETRNLGEILRSLAAKGVIDVPATPELPGAPLA